ncbi:NAD(P)H-dependent oxidoreductase [Paenibacillus sp. CC-CFT747]|nr:NAD(P)H-dependent oxidoreductase [Paenibacillus sp. CC-CFT747]
MNIFILAGSNRKDATSTQICRYLEKELQARDCETVFFDLYEKPVSFYTPEGYPEGDANLTEMKKAAAAADAIILATPEYHGGMSGVLKNALDHMGGAEFDSKAVLSVSSAGGAVGVSSLQQMQVLVRNVHGINSPEWISIGGDQREFDSSGEPASVAVKERAIRALNYFLQLAGQLKKEV